MVLEDTVEQPALSSGQHELQIGRQPGALLQAEERIHQTVQVLARLQNANSQDERRVAHAEVAPCLPKLLRLGNRTESVLDTAGYDSNRRRVDAEQDDQVVPRVLGVGDDEVGAPDRARYDLFQVAAQARVSAVRAHQKRQVVDRQDAARVAKRRQHEVRAVVHVDGSAEPVGWHG